MKEGARADIQARLRRVPKVIVADTWANRAQMTRQTRELFKEWTKKKVKRPGRGGRTGRADDPGMF